MVTRAKYNATTAAIYNIILLLVEKKADRFVVSKYTQETIVHRLARAAILPCDDEDSKLICMPVCLDVGVNKVYILYTLRARFCFTYFCSTCFVLCCSIQSGRYSSKK